MTDRLCQQCTYQRKNFVPGTGPERAKVAILGEAPGREEVKLGKPFVGESGRLLKMTLQQLGVKVEELYVTNVCHCWPPGNVKPSAFQRMCCGGAPLREELRQRGVEVVIALGNTALEEMLDFTGITKVRGAEYTSKDGFTVFPTFHPAAILRNVNYFQDFERDLRHAFGMIKPVDQRPYEWSVARDPQTAISFMDRLRGPVVLDLETSGYNLYDDMILCVVLAPDAEHGMVIPADLMDDDAVFAKLHEVAKRDDICWVGHNLQFDAAFLEVGWGVKIKIGFDTLLAHYVLDERKGTHDLKVLAAQLFDAPDWEGTIKQYLRHPKKDSYALLPPAVLYEYNAFDGKYTYLLYEYLKSLIDNDVQGRKLFYDVLMPATNALVKLTVGGIKVDLDRLAALRKQGEEAQEVSLAKMRVLAGKPMFNPRSPIQVREVLYGQLKAPTVDRSMVPGIPPELTAPAGLSHTRKDTTAMFQLERLTFYKGKVAEFAKLLIDYRHWKQLVRTYLANYEPLKDGRVHPSFMLFGTVSGRLSSTRPNVLNMPHVGGIRGLIIPEPGNVILVLDYSQNELRVLAAVSGAEGLRNIYKSGQDLHRTVCEWFYGPNYTPKQRMIAKSFNFGLVYGRSAKSIAQAFQITERDAQDKMDILMERMGIRTWREKAMNQAVEDGFVLSPLGRRRRFPLITDMNIAEVGRQAINSPIQGTGSDLNLLSMVEICGWIDEYAGKVLVPIHDSIVLEVPVVEAVAVAQRARAVMLATPARALNTDVPWKVGVEWGESYDETALTEMAV